MWMSASEIVAELAGNEGFKTLNVERISHWKREGMLPVASDFHPGRGGLVRYDDSVLPIVRVLNRMADGGLTVRIMKHVLDHIKLHMDRDYHFVPIDDEVTIFVRSA